MDQKAKGLTVALVVMAVLFLGLSGAGFYLFQKERESNAVLQDELSQIKTRLMTTEQKLDESKKTVSDLQVRLDDAKAEINDISAKLDQEKLARQETAAKMEQFKADLDTQKGLRAELEVKFNQAQDEARKAKVQLNDLVSQKTELEKKISNLEEKTSGIELGKIVVSPEQNTNAPQEGKRMTQAEAIQPVKKTGGSLEGKVLVINKEYNFAVINMGTKDGVSLGNVFGVYRGDKYLGDVKVEKVRDSMAAAGFVSADLKDKVNEGDRVLQKS